MTDQTDHIHKWRATTKVFALVCECGVPYHDWLLMEIEKLKAAATDPMQSFVSPEDVERLQGELSALRESSQQEIDKLHAALAIAHGESARLRADLDEARREIEVQTEEVSGALAGA